MSLRELIEAVDAGRDDSEKWYPALGDHGYTAMTAFHGSLDAAKALHDALLPGWGFELCEFSADVTNRNVDDGIAGYKFFTGRNDNPARAWLLAILRAMEAEGR